MNHNKTARLLASQKSTLESELMAKLESGEIKTGSNEWREYCDKIEDLADLSNRYQTAYEENN